MIDLTTFLTLVAEVNHKPPDIEGRDIIISMLVVGLIFLGVILLGELSKRLTQRRRKN
tara:strand:+ start:496 stop:669 length:174 start_codon:yes stop_codon:yes gene_type:complete